jgi:hypothetical protein
MLAAMNINLKRTHHSMGSKKWPGGYMAISNTVAVWEQNGHLQPAIRDIVKRLQTQNGTHLQQSVATPSPLLPQDADTHLKEIFRQSQQSVNILQQHYQQQQQHTQALLQQHSAMEHTRRAQLAALLGAVSEEEQRRLLDSMHTLLHQPSTVVSGMPSSPAGMPSCNENFLSPLQTARETNMPATCTAAPNTVYGATALHRIPSPLPPEFRTELFAAASTCPPSPLPSEYDTEFTWSSTLRPGQEIVLPKPPSPLYYDPECGHFVDSDGIILSAEQQLQAEGAAMLDGGMEIDREDELMSERISMDFLQALINDPDPAPAPATSDLNYQVPIPPPAGSISSGLLADSPPEEQDLLDLWDAVMEGRPQEAELMSDSDGELARAYAMVWDDSE